MEAPYTDELRDFIEKNDLGEQVTAAHRVWLTLTPGEQEIANTAIASLIRDQGLTGLNLRIAWMASWVGMMDKIRDERAMH
jgi:hypothetical protein